jgi:hypothetical protein
MKIENSLCLEIDELNKFDDLLVDQRNKSTDDFEICFLSTVIDDIHDDILTYEMSLDFL